MALTQEDLQAIAALLQPIKDEIQGIQGSIHGIQGEIQGIQGEIQGIQGEIQGIHEEIREIKEEMQEMKRRITNIELHLENNTDKNIQLLAENFINLTTKLNQAIPAADKNLAYEVKVNYLVSEVDKLKIEIAELKNKIA